MRRDRRRERNRQFRVEPLEGRIAPGFMMTSVVPADVAATDAGTAISKPGNVSLEGATDTDTGISRPAN